MSSAAPDESPRKLELSPVQVAASALAAMSAAFVASWAGTAGTLIGAAVGSVIATVGAATYSYSLNRTQELARRTASQVREGAMISRPARAGDTQRFETVPRTAAEEAPPATGWRRFDPRHAELPWGKVALASAAVLLVVMVAITSFEGLTGRSVADATRGSDSSGNTTVGNLVGNDPDGQAPTDDDAERPGDDGRPERTEAPGTDESADPTPAPEPTEEPSPEPTEEPSEVPEPSPTPTPTADSQGEPTASPSA